MGEDRKEWCDGCMEKERGMRKKVCGEKRGGGGVWGGHTQSRGYMHKYYSSVGRRWEEERKRGGRGRGRKEEREKEF